MKHSVAVMLFACPLIGCGDGSQSDAINVGDPSNETQTTPLEDEGLNAVGSAPAIPQKPVPAAAADPTSYCSVNAQTWVNGCRADCTAGWEGSTCPTSCTASAPPGYVIADYEIVDRDVNNGGLSASYIPASSKFDYKSAIEQAYKSAEEAAGKANDKAAQASIREEMSNLIRYATQYESSHQVIKLDANASKHGWRLNKKRGWSKGDVRMKVQCVVPEKLSDRLYEKYGYK